jgi:hypothetical protein
VIITPQLEYEPTTQLRLLAMADRVGEETFLVTVWSPDIINGREVFQLRAAQDYHAVQEAMALYQRRYALAARSRVITDVAAG